MINWTLVKRNIKSNYKMFLIISAVLTMYISVIVMLFDPEMGDAIKQMIEAMPQLTGAFGMTSNVSTLIEFMASYLYGFLLYLLPLIFIIVLTNNLVARYVDNGSMAYLLASPNTRIRIIVTQAMTSIVWIALFFAEAAILGVVMSELMFPGALDLERFLVLNINLVCLMFAVGGLCFSSSCLFNDRNKAIFAAAGIHTAFYLLQVLTNVSDKVDFLKYATIMTLFPYMDIATGKTDGYVQMIVLVVMGIAFYTGGCILFTRKDLPI